MSEFLAMDGYAVYVWPSFAVTAAFLVVMALVPWLRHRKLRRALRGGGR